MRSWIHSRLAGVGNMHELHPDASAVVALGLVGIFAIKVEFGNGFGQKVLPQRVEFGLQMAPTAKGCRRSDLAVKSISWRDVPGEDFW